MDDKKPGYKTTEFWLSALAVIAGMVLASGALGEHTGLYQALSFGLTALGALGYTASRTLVKASELKAKTLIEANKLNGSSGNE